eukprot:s1047_g14.t1
MAPEEEFEQDPSAATSSTTPAVEEPGENNGPSGEPSAPAGPASASETAELTTAEITAPAATEAVEEDGDATLPHPDHPEDPPREGTTS